MKAEMIVYGMAMVFAILVFIYSIKEMQACEDVGGVMVRTTWSIKCVKMQVLR